MKTETMWNHLFERVANAGEKLLFAALVLVVGGFLIRLVLKGMGKSKLLGKLDPSVRSILDSAVKIVLYALLIIADIGILGIPMTSVITVLASCGVAVGLALQGALSNVAGGIMLLIFKPIRIGDYVEIGASAGTVENISLFYTSLTTPDNRRITLPNGSLMAGVITNHSAEENRRVDVLVKVPFGTDRRVVEKLLLEIAQADERVWKDPAPYARFNGCAADGLGFSLRVWVDGKNYWDVYADAAEAIYKKLTELGIAAATTQVKLDK